MSATVLDDNIGGYSSATTAGKDHIVYDYVNLKTNTKDATLSEEMELSTNAAYGRV